MTANGYLQLALYLVVLLALAKPLGAYMARVYENQPISLGPVSWARSSGSCIAWRESARTSRWPGRATPSPCSLFNMLGLLAVYLLQRVQGSLPLNPAGPRRGLAGPGIQHRRQLRVQHELAIVWRRDDDELPHPDARPDRAELRLGGRRAWRASSRSSAVWSGVPPRRSATSGSTWSAPRSTSSCPCPSSGAILLVSQGVVQTFQPYVEVQVVQPTTYDEPATDEKGQPVLDEKGQPKMNQSTLKEQVLAVGPAASQIIIKQLGTNGGGFFNVNSAHPFENATPLSNFLEVLAILAHPGRALLHVRCHGEGHAAGMGHPGGDDADLRADSWSCPWRSEQAGNPAFAQLGRRPRGERPPVRRQHGGQGGPVRHCQLRPLGHGHHGGVQRLGELHARLLHTRWAGWCRCG